jgi:hypothetical protein
VLLCFSLVDKRNLSKTCCCTCRYRELLEGANELRLMLCREKIQGTKKGTSVIAACGKCG